MPQKTLVDDDFGRFPVGAFSKPVGPHTEYHFLEEAVPQFGWSVAAFASGFHPSGMRYDCAWVVEEAAGRKWMTQRFRNPKIHTHPMIIHGERDWCNYSLEVRMEATDIPGNAGLVFRYHNARCYYFFGFCDNGLVLKAVKHETNVWVPYERILAYREYCWEVSREYCLRVDLRGNRIVAQVQGGPRMEVEDSLFPPKGKIGLTADVPVRYYSVKATVSEEQWANIHVSLATEEKRRAALKDLYPSPAVWKRFKTPGYGVGRNLRFGDLTGNGTADILVTQVKAHGPKDSYSECGCMTAVTLDGEILWQSGTPDPGNAGLTNDVAVQIHDIDGDGRNEVVYCRDFELVVADGRTGEPRMKVPTPHSYPEADKFDRILGDSLFFCDLRGSGRAADIVLKDRYWHFWVYDDSLTLLWNGHCRTGHYPYAFDIDNDGKDELAMGYAVYDHDGRLLWNNEDSIPDHADGVAVVNISMDPNDDPVLFYAGSDAGLTLVDSRGRIIKRRLVGHAQNPAIARFRDDIPGLQIVCINFWGNQGILHFLDAEGNIYKDIEPLNMGSMCLPCNWSGNGTELFVHNPHPRWGGMYDGWGNKAVEFPEDGHPSMCNAVLDLHGDCRDEIVVWDPHEVWIYTQDDNPKKGPLYKPVRNGQYNNSNYQATLSLPGWEE